MSDTFSAIFTGADSGLFAAADHCWKHHPSHYRREQLVLASDLAAARARIAALEAERDRLRVALLEIRDASYHRNDLRNVAGNALAGEEKP